jgi:hypothetical protein
MMKIASPRMVFMAEISTIMLKKLKHNLLFLRHPTSSLEVKVYLIKFYLRIKWVPLGGTISNGLKFIYEI